MKNRRKMEDRKILLYGPSRHRGSGKFQSMLRSLVGEERMEIFDRIEAFSQRLKKPRGNVNIAVLMAPTKGALRDIISLGELLLDLRIILIVPDMKPETVSTAHQIAPRFVTDCGSDLQTTKKVLQKMLRGPKPSKGAHNQTGQHGLFSAGPRTSECCPSESSSE